MKRAFLTLLTAAFFCLFTNAAYSYWIWTPKTGKWVNPKNAVKPTPKEQLELAKGLYENKNYEESRREFKKLLKNYPKAVEAAESQYYLGLIEEGQHNFYEAFLAYQKVIDKYPFSERIQEILEREYKIAERFMAGEKRKAIGADNPAIEIFAKVVENSNYGPLAPVAQYKLGLVLKGLMRYFEAEEAFNKVLSNYPNSEWAEAAKFQLAACRAAASRSSDYDQGATKEAKNKFEEFVREHPDAVLSKDAQKSIEQLGEKEAESSYNTGRFYEKQKAFDSAAIYYNDLINNHSKSPWAVRALERLQIIEKLKKK